MKSLAHSSLYVQGHGAEIFIANKGITAYPFCQEMNMVYRIARLTGSSGITFLIITMVAILLPNPKAKLCITPGSHIAIEEMDSECCEPHGVSVPAILQSQSRMAATGSCGNCIDLMIEFFGPETVPASPCPTGIPSCESLRVLATAESSASTLRQRIAGNETLNTAFSSLPLLC